MTNEEFRLKVKEEIDEIGIHRGIVNEGSKFEVWFATKILGEEEGVVVDEYQIGGSGDEKIDIGICDEEHELKFIIQCKYSENEKMYNKDEVDQILGAINRLKICPNDGNKKRQEFVKKYNKNDDKLEKNILAVFGYIQQDALKYALENNIEVYDIEKIKSRYIYNNTDNPINKPELITLKRNCNLGSCCNHTEDADVYTIYIDIKEIYKIVYIYKDGVFAENLRSRLTGSSKSLIANDIQNTIKTRPERLVAMNNGLTITGRDVCIEDDSISIVEPQIVNGCQTSWAIYDVCELLRDTDKYDNLESFISVKIIKTAITDISVDVTKSTNTQNPIYIRDTFSNKEEQLELNLAFKQNKQPVLYEHKEGQFNMLKREHKHTLYRAKGNTYRRIDNTFAGQLYIALMGKPSYSKHKMREIFTNQDIYRTIFRYDLSEEERFNNSAIGTTCNSIKLRTGKTEFFVEDILFALKIYKFMDIYKGKLKERLDNPELEEDTRQILMEKSEYIKIWNYYIVYSINYIVESLCKDNNRVDFNQVNELREKLLGDDLNVFFNNELKNILNVSTSVDSHLILDEENLPEQQRLLCEWIMSLDQIMFDLVSEARKSSNFQDVRAFLELNTNTIEEYKKKINSIIKGNKRHRELYFPTN